MIRATTGGVMRTYRSNLMNSFINMNANRNTVLSQRTFNSFAEDPAAAAKAFRLRKSRMTVESQYDICTEAMGKYQQAVSCLQSIDDILCTKDGVYGQYMKTITGTTLSMLNDPEGDAREQLTVVLDQLSQQIVQTMNQKYGDNFIFAGADAHNVPFEIKDNVLYYRGVPVDAAIPNVMTQKGADGKENLVAVAGDGQIIDDPENYPGQIYYFNMDGAKLVSIDELQENLAKTQVKTDNTSGEPIAYKYIDGDTLGRYEPITEGDDYDGPVYYALDDGSDDFIPAEEYEEAQEFVSSSVPMLYSVDGSNNAASVRVDENGNPADDGKYYLHIQEDSLMKKEDYDAAVLDWEKLQYLAQETQFVDIGLGFQEDPVTGKLIETSAFNAALNGINFLGYGLDEDGDPKNIYSLIQKMREVAENASKNDSWTKDYDEFHRLAGKLEDAVSTYQTEYVNLDASSGKLKGQQELLVNNFDTLQEQYSDIEDVDMVDAITSFIWAEYCYNAALKVGNSILSESLMDYLR